MDSPGRYELKYVLDLQKMNRIRNSISKLMEPDEHNEEHGYRVDSLYYDTPDLAWFWDKVEGEKIRTKMRIRTYPKDFRKTENAFVEFKMKTGHVVTKRRVRLRTEHALMLCSGQSPDTFESLEQERFCEETQAMVHAMSLKPAAFTSYMRVAFFSEHSLSKLRITFDTLCKGRVNELGLFSDSPLFSFLPQDMGIMELKTDSSVPGWLLDILQFYRVKMTRMSKYCTVAALGRGIEVLPLVSLPARFTGENHHG